MIYTKDETTGAMREEYIEDMRSGEEVEIDAAMFEDWLGCLPPIFMNKEVRYTPPKPGGQETLRRVSFGFCEGADDIILFWTDRRETQADGSGVRYYCQNSGVRNYASDIARMFPNAEDRQKHNVYTGDPVGPAYDANGIPFG